MKIDEAMKLIRSCKHGDKYVVRDKTTKLNLERAFRFVFEENASNYVGGIVLDERHIKSVKDDDDLMSV